MMDLTKKLRGKAINETNLEYYKYVDSLSKGTAKMTDSDCAEIDELNKQSYDAMDCDALCPGWRKNPLFDADLDYCACMQCARCKLLDFVEQHSEETVGEGDNLLFGYHIRLPWPYSPGTIKLMDPDARIHLMDLYDKYRAVSIQVSWQEKKNSETSSPQLTDVAELDVWQEFLSEFETIYWRTKMDCWSRKPSTEQELRDAYEKAQYLERKKLGEPVLFRNGRCWFEGFVASQGYRPGPFPGLDLYIKDKEQVDPQQFTQWLSDMEPARKKSNLPPVGYFGSPVCAVYAADLFKYYVKWHGCIGAATKRLSPYNHHYEL